MEAQGLVRPDLVEHDPVGLGLAVEVFDGGYLLVDAVEVLVLQRAEAAFADAVLAGTLGPGTDVQQLRAGGDEPGEGDALERPAVVGDPLDPMRLAGVRVGRQQLGQRGPAQAFGLGIAMRTASIASVPVQVGAICQPCSYFVK
ncbi:hypothetical protein ABH926_010334 [Catenulispora sp. GP43]